MKTVCTFCSRVVSEGTFPEDPVSHGVCPDCYDRILSEYGFDVKKFLDEFEHPVLLVDADVRVLAANSLALDLLGKPASFVRGTLCGEVLGCINASCKGGCGKADLCPDCTFRASVSETYTTGLPGESPGGNSCPEKRRYLMRCAVPCVDTNGWPRCPAPARTGKAGVNDAAAK